MPEDAAKVHLQRLFVLLGVVLFIVGLALGTYLPDRVGFLGDAVKGGIGVLAALAPFIIFFTLTPAIGGLIRLGEARRFAGSVILVYTATTTVAGLWALTSMSLLFGLSFTGEAATLGEAVGRMVGQFQVLMLHSDAMAAIFLAVVAGFFAAKSDAFNTPFRLVASGIERLGEGLIYVLPALLFMFGAALPVLIGDAAARAAEAGAEGGTVAGLGPLGAYFLVIALIAALLVPWVIAFALIVRRVTGMSLREYFAEHFAYVYPFAFASASSVATIPINLERTGKGLGVRQEVREFIVPLGATVNMDGTMVGAVVITVVTAMLMGYQPSVVDLLFTIVPLVIVTVGVPGIPGGLGIVVAPILADMLPLPPGTELAFFGVWVAFSIGLGDNIRTGVNVTDDALISRLFDHWFGHEFAAAEAEGLPVVLEEVEPAAGDDAAASGAGTGASTGTADP